MTAENSGMPPERREGGIRNLENPRNPILSQKVQRERSSSGCMLLQEEAPPTDLHSLHAEVLMTMGQTKVKAMEDMLVVKCLL